MINLDRSMLLPQQREMRSLLIGLAVLALCIVAPSAVLLLAGKKAAALVPLAAAATLLVITHPKIALYQYLFVIFIQWEIVPSVPIFATDLSAALVILAGLLDLLMGDRLPARLPRLTVNFLWLLAAVLVAAMFGASPATSLRPIARLAFILLTFLAVFRLAGGLKTEQLLRIFFWVGVLHSLIVLAGFVASGGSARSFGFSPMLFGSLAMTALPVGISLFLWEPRRWSVLYLIGSLILLGAMISTQSRFPTIFGLGLSVLVVILSAHRRRRIRWAVEHGTAESFLLPPAMGRRIWMAVATPPILVLIAFTFVPSLFTGVIDRFQSIWYSPTGQTVALRIALWGFAIKAFLADPVTGIGPGCFRNIQEIMPTLRLVPVSPWVRGLSAHNLFLHYLAETGLIGSAALAALFVNLYRMARRLWKAADKRGNQSGPLALYALGAMFLLTTFLETGWLWSQTAHTFAFLAALIVREYHRTQLDSLRQPAPTF